LAVALDDPCHSLLPIGLAEVFVLLRLDVPSPATHNGVTLFLDDSFISCHPPLPAGGELAGVWLGEGKRELYVPSLPPPLLSSSNRAHPSQR